MLLACLSCSALTKTYTDSMHVSSASLGRTASPSIKKSILQRTMRCWSRDIVAIYQVQHRPNILIKPKPHPSTSMLPPLILSLFFQKTKNYPSMICFSWQLLVSLIHARHILRTVTVTVSRPPTSRYRQKKYSPRLRNSVINATCHAERSAIQRDPSSRCNSEVDVVDGVDRDIIRGDTSHVFEDRLQETIVLHVRGAAMERSAEGSCRCVAWRVR